jgi:hypothetical protein
MTTNWFPLLQRLRYWQGQALRSRDLNDQMAFEDLLRAWHNRALHQAYGIREGLDVALDLTGPAVIVSPGLAYDARGRELISGQTRQLPLPEIPTGGLILALSYRETGTPCSKDLSEVCWPGNAPVDRATRLVWIRPDRFDPRQAVALARLIPGPVLAPAFNAPQARPLAKPRIGHGSTIPGNTAWRLWERDTGPEPEPSASPAGTDEEPDDGDEEIVEIGAVEMVEIEAAAVAAAAVQVKPEVRVFGLEVDVDTRATGFTAVPCYQAWVEGDLWSPDLIDLIAGQFTTSQLTTNTSFWRLGSGLALLQLLEMRFGHIHQPTATGFTYRLWFPQIGKWQHTRSLFEYLLLLAQQSKLTVAWIGVQENAAVETMALDAQRLPGKEIA